MITDDDLRVNYDFVLAFEALRKSYGHREMNDTALQEIAASSDVPYETLRVWRHLRNALAHGDRVNRDQLAKQHALVQRLTEINGNNTARPTTRARATSPAPVTQRAESDLRGSDRRAFRIHAWTDDRLEPSASISIAPADFVERGGSRGMQLPSIGSPPAVLTWDGNAARQSFA